MKKLILAFFLMAFVSVSFSATSLISVKKEVKKEIITNSENQILEDVKSEIFFDSKTTISPVKTACLNYRKTIPIANQIDKKDFYFNLKNYSYFKNRHIQKNNFNKEKTNISR